MRPNTFVRTASALVLLAGVTGFAANTRAQNAGANSGTVAAPEKTGVGERGTKAGPSTDPGLDKTSSSSPSQTGVGERGGKAGPTTPPPASGSQGMKDNK
jgi:hypothetical protein